MNYVIRLLAMAFLALSACTDYESVVDDKYEEWKASLDDIPNSSSNVIRSSSSNVILSENEESSSSFKASWTYLNPDIDYGEMMDTRDNQVYKTVTIGSQTWMAENLNYETGNSWCYDDKTSNCDKYGRLYTWSAVMDSAAQFSVNAGTKCGYGETCTPNSPHRGICPEGWHVPTNEEYSTLYTYIGGSSTAGSLLKSTSGWYDSDNGSDEYGFSLLPDGLRDLSGDFYNEGDLAYLWSASEYNSDYAWGQYFRYDDDYADRSDNNKNSGQSLRCLKDSSPTSGAATSSSSQAQPSSSSSDVIPDPDRGSSSSSITYGTLTDSRDNQVYKTVTIGTQTWMAENLNYRYVGVKYDYNGYTSDSTSWCYDNLASNCDKYGSLYTWSAVMDSAAQFSVNAGTQCGYGKACTPNSPHRGICPEGWHVPTNEEYSTLYTYISGSSIAGSLLKSTSGWYNSGNGSDEYGFSVLPAGYRLSDGFFGNRDIMANLWTASEDYSGKALSQYFHYDVDDVDQSNLNKNSGRSLRCLKD